MAALAARTAASCACLRADCAQMAGTIAEVQEHVGLLAELLRQPGTRLCLPAAAAATDASLALLSGLRAAQLRLHACDWDQEREDVLTGALEGCQHRLLSALQQGVAPATPALAPAATTRPASGSSGGPTPGGRRHDELAQLVGGLGCTVHEWQVAQAALAQSTACALQAVGAAGPGGAPASLDSLLQAAVATPAWQPPGGQRSTVHAAAQQLLWVLRQLPPGGDAMDGAAAARAATRAASALPRHQLSAEGWAAYWMLEPMALQQTLAEILHATTQQQQQQERQAAGDRGSLPPHDLPHQLARHPHWAFLAAGAAAQPALHLAMRHTLHAWLAASGNPAAWSLLLLLMQTALDGAAQQQGGSGSLLLGQLPAQVRLLYPPGLACAAALLLTQRPTEAGMETAVEHLQSFLQGMADDKAAVQAAQQQQALGMEPLPGAAARCQVVWRLQLDAAAWALFCLRCLPLHRLLQQGAPGGSNSDADTELPDVAMDGDSTGGGAAAAAAYIALLLWPGEPRRQQALAPALQGQLAGVSLAALRPCLEQLQGWQHLLQAHCAASTT